MQTLKQYLPGNETPELPVLYKKEEEQHISERELLYKVLFEMKKDMTELKKIVASLMEQSEHKPTAEQTKALLVKEYSGNLINDQQDYPEIKITHPPQEEVETFHPTEVVEESLSLQEKENELIKKALEKHHGKRKSAAKELGISERTLYRKIKEYNIR